MRENLDSLRRKVSETGLFRPQGELFELLSAGCFFCCHDGARGGNDSCGPKLEQAG